MTVTVSSGGYANSADSSEMRVTEKRGSTASTPFSLPGANPCVLPIRNSKTRCANSGGAAAYYAQPMRRAVCLRRARRIRRSRREPNRGMGRTLFSRVHTHLPEDRSVPSAGLSIHTDLFRIHGTGDLATRGVTWAVARYLPRRTLPPVPPRRFRPCSGTAKTCFNGKFVWRCF